MTAHLQVLRLIVCLAAVALGGCASRAAPLTAASTPAPEASCAQRFEPQQAIAVSADPLQPTRQRIDAASTCAGVVLFRLPRFRQAWTLDVGSAFDGAQLYAPQAQLLDEHGRVQRELSFDRFALRGEQLQATLFFDASASTERYLRLLPAREVLGQGGRRVLSGSFVIPLLNTVMPVVYMQGTESEREFVYSDSGVVHLATRGATSLRRQPQAHELARRHLAAFAH